MALTLDASALGEALAKLVKGDCAAAAGKVTEALVTALAVTAGAGPGGVVAGKALRAAVESLAGHVADGATQRFLAEGKRIDESRQAAERLQAVIAECLQEAHASQEPAVVQLLAAVQELEDQGKEQLLQLQRLFHSGTEAILKQEDEHHEETSTALRGVDQKLDRLIAGQRGAEGRWDSAAPGAAPGAAPEEEQTAEQEEPELAEGMKLDQAMLGDLHQALESARAPQSLDLEQLLKAGTEGPINPAALLGKLLTNLGALDKGTAERRGFVGAARSLIDAVLAWAVQEGEALQLKGDEPISADCGSPLLATAAMWRAQGRKAGKLKSHPTNGPRGAELLFNASEDHLLESGPLAPDFLSTFEAFLWHRRQFIAEPYDADRDRQALRVLLKQEGAVTLGYRAERDGQELRDILEADAFEDARPFALLNADSADQWRTVSAALPEVTFLVPQGRRMLCRKCSEGALAQLVNRFLRQTQDEQ